MSELKKVGRKKKLATKSTANTNKNCYIEQQQQQRKNTIVHRLKFMNLTVIIGTIHMCSVMALFVIYAQH